MEMSFYEFCIRTNLLAVHHIPEQENLEFLVFGIHVRQNSSSQKGELDFRTSHFLHHPV
jgi:hypothetical protein